MATVLWTVTVLVALVFAVAGLMKLAQPREKLAAPLPWVTEFSQGAVRTIGLAEVLGALGLILPRILHLLPWLSVAAAGLIALMIGAISVHLRRKEPIIPNVVLSVLSAVALG